jgi:predicted nucleotide-binding protein (sugar kinase/HSP70/actin superfamily)
MRIGVPRALSFFRFHPAWEAFFQQLGAEVVISPPTTRATLEAGLAYTVPESCLPLKLFFGHVRALVDQVDVILVPSIHRLAPGSTNCARLIGLPDLLQASMPDLPPLIAPDVDLGKARALWGLVLEAGTRLTFNPLTLRDAARAGWAAYLRARAALLEGSSTPADYGRPAPEPLPSGSGPTVAVVGHPYNLYEPFVNHRLLSALARLGVRLLTPERLGPWPSVDYWTFEYELVGATRLALEQGEVDGALAVISFGCGPDGSMLEEVWRLAGPAAVPVMTLTLDEHSGEAGLLTRIEAFVDMLNHRRRADGRSIPGN